MRILVISDIHANLTALQAVLKAAGKVDATWCLGDLVGYGPDPDDCLDLIRTTPNLTCMIGNHDAAVIDSIDTSFFNQDARFSAQWAKQHISKKNISFLKDLPEILICGDVTMVHGSPRNSVWEYLLDPFTVEINFSFFETRFCFAGHTHIPTVYSFKNSCCEMIRIDGQSETIDLQEKMILNPGSVGQPRDRDKRASYAIYYPENCTWEFHRVEYDIREVQSRIIHFELPFRNAERLSEGW